MQSGGGHDVHAAPAAKRNEAIEVPAIVHWRDLDHGVSPGSLEGRELSKGGPLIVEYEVRVGIADAPRRAAEEVFMAHRQAEGARGDRAENRLHHAHRYTPE